MKGIIAALKVFVLALAVSAFSLAGAASAQDNDDEPDPGEIVEGIIGGILGGAEEDEGRCEWLERRCEDGADWACDRYEELCK
jgi:hypothetical protein